MKKLFMLIAFLLAISNSSSKIYAEQKHNAPSAQLTPTFETSTRKVYDPRVEAIRNVLERNNSPLVDEAEHYVFYADKYNIDWKLLASIAGLESTFGKFHVQGSHNAYGWGGGYIYFDSWEDGIATISQALRQNYYDRGADTVYKIGPIYAESPTWSPRVTFFMNKIEEEHNMLIKQTAGLVI